MQTLAYGARGLRLLAYLNMDRLLMTGTMVGALMLAAYLAQFI
ncbi:hypothetical protein ACS3SW_02430 [Roseobacteraceae bacterium S113]